MDCAVFLVISVFINAGCFAWIIYLDSRNEQMTNYIKQRLREMNRESR